VLWSILVCVDNFTFKILSVGLQFKPDNWNFDFIKISTQIINIFFQNFDKIKNNLIYIEMVKVVR